MYLEEEIGWKRNDVNVCFLLHSLSLPEIKSSTSRRRVKMKLLLTLKRKFQFIAFLRMTWNGMKFNLFWYFVFNVSREIYKETLNYYFIYSCSRLNFLDGMNFFVYILLIDGLLEWNGINRDNVYVISKNELMGIFCQTKLKRAYETNSIRYKSSTKTIFYFSALHISADEKFVRYDTYEWCAAHENHCNYCYHKIIQHNHRHLSSILQTISVLGNRFSFRGSKTKKKDQKKRNNVALFSFSPHWLSAFFQWETNFANKAPN